MSSLTGKVCAKMKDASEKNKKEEKPSKKSEETLSQKVEVNRQKGDEQEKAMKGAPKTKETSEGKQDPDSEPPPAETVPEIEDEKDTNGGKSDPAEKSSMDEGEKHVREKEELEDKYLRLRADFENFRKRSNKEKANLIQYGNESLLGDLLPVVDNIERVLTYSFQESGWEHFREGIELVLTEIHKTLGRYGVRAIDALGKPFDPNLHEAMQRVETDDAPPDTVVEEYQKGYFYHERLLRASRVAVAVAHQEEQKDEASKPEGRSPEENGEESRKEEKKILQ